MTLKERVDTAMAAAERNLTYARTQEKLRSLMIDNSVHPNVVSLQTPQVKDAFAIIEFIRYCKEAFESDAKIVAFLRGDDLPRKFTI